jgi:hypothetical protein
MPHNDVAPFGAPLPHVTDAPLLGIRVRFETNSADALRMMEEEFGEWRSLLAASDLSASPVARFQLVVQENGTSADHGPVHHRFLDPDRLVLQTPGSFGIVDSARAEAIAYVTPALLADDASARHAFIRGMTLTLVSARNRYPVHAAAIARGSTALLLAGPPGTGKSTLAYQAHRRGLRVLSDDASYVQVEPELKIWGIPGRVYLPADAQEHFPELADRGPTRLPNGDEKLIVDVQTAASHAPVASRAGVCLLERGTGQVRVTRASGPDVRAFLKAGLGTSLYRFDDGLDRALERLVPAGGWRLSLSGNPSHAAPLLDELLTEVERSV